MVHQFARHRERLRRMVRLRLDRRLQGRIDSSDVLQEAHLEVARRAGVPGAADDAAVSVVPLPDQPGAAGA